MAIAQTLPPEGLASAGLGPIPAGPHQKVLGLGTLGRVTVSHPKGLRLRSPVASGCSNPLTSWVFRAILGSDGWDSWRLSLASQRERKLTLPCLKTFKPPLLPQEVGPGVNPFLLKYPPAGELFEGREAAVTAQGLAAGLAPGDIRKGLWCRLHSCMPVSNSPETPTGPRQRWSPGGHLPDQVGQLYALLPFANPSGHGPGGVKPLAL